MPLRIKATLEGHLCHKGTQSDGFRIEPPELLHVGMS
jgi:hypothetical protein